MKKIFMLMIVLLFVLMGCSSKNGEISYIDINQLNEKIENSDDFVLVLGLDTCTACIAYKPTLEELVNNKNLDIYYLQLKASWSDSAKQEVIDYFSDKLNYSIMGTPTTFFIKDGEIEDDIIGDVPYLEILGLLQEKDYVQ